METPGDRLRQARERARFPSAAAAARRHHWTYTTYVSHENGQTDVPREAAIEYARAFNTTPEWIMFAVGKIDDLGFDRMLADQPEDMRERARRMIELLLGKDSQQP